MHQLVGHEKEISSTQFEFTGEYCATSSIDGTCRLWDVRMGKCLKVFTGHSDEVLDICFNSTGTKLATASADSTCKIYNVAEAECIMTLEGTD